ncbi:MAG: DoxX family protein [Myxococcota bacterium]
MTWLTWSPLARFADLGQLVLRAGVGAMMVLHGWPKVAGGAAGWDKLGHAIGVLGIDFAFTFWGAMAAFSEFLGGALLVIGLGTRPASAALAFTMLVATLMHLKGGDGFNGASHAMALGFVFVGLLFVGAGRYSVDRRLGG